MNGCTAPLRTACASVLAATVLVIGAAPPCAAGEPPTASTRPASLSTASSATLKLLTTAADTARATQAPPAGTEAGSFFRSRKGAVALVLIGAGFGYTLYSKSHDRVRSQVR